MMMITARAIVAMTANLAILIYSHQKMKIVMNWSNNNGSSKEEEEGPKSKNNTHCKARASKKSPQGS